MHDTWRKYVAEGIGTFVFIFVAIGATMANWQSGGALGTVGVAMASGLTLAAMIYALYHVSGAHLNPAITIAMWATGHIKTVMAVGYIVAQLVGSVVAAIFVKILFGTMAPQYFLGDVALGINVSPGLAIVTEAVLAFFLVWIFFGTLVDKKTTPGFGGLAVGFALITSIIVAGNLTMGALNPARSFGPALLTSHWATHYVYWVGPVVGALIAGFIYNYIFIKKPE